MSLYNLMFGQNKAAPIILATLGLSAVDVGRFRDAWIEKDENGGARIAIYTRNGGGNRDHWNNEAEAGPECGCTGCTITHAVPKHPCYLFDQDDDFDCTYATIYYRLPDEYAADLSAVALDQPHDPSQAWIDLLARLAAASK